MPVTPPFAFYSKDTPPMVYFYK